MKRVIASNSNNVVMPTGFGRYYKVASKEDIDASLYDTDYIATPDLLNLYKSYGLEHVGLLIALPRYEAYLADSGLGLLDICKDTNGDVVAVYNVGDRVYDADLNEIRRIAEGV